MMDQSVTIRCPQVSYPWPHSIHKDEHGAMHMLLPCLSLLMWPCGGEGKGLRGEGEWRRQDQEVSCATTLHLLCWQGVGQEKVRSIAPNKPPCSPSSRGAREGVGPLTPDPPVCSSRRAEPCTLPQTARWLMA